MKINLVRAFVFALALVGFTASSVAASHAKTTASVGSVNSMTGSYPSCVPSDPSHCGMD